MKQLMETKNVKMLKDLQEIQHMMALSAQIKMSELNVPDEKVYGYMVMASGMLFCNSAKLMDKEGNISYAESVEFMDSLMAHTMDEE